MKLSLLHDHPDARLVDVLGRFEPEFSYPLGAGRRFHVVHGADGWRFFASLGEAVYAVAESDGQVLGVLGAALRRVVQPDDLVATVLYLCDL